MGSNTTISNSLIATLAPREKAYDVRDSRVKGFVIRVNPSGAMSYAVQYARGKRVNLGKVGVIKPSQAREKAIQILADHTHGIAPQPASQPKHAIPLLKHFLADDYGPWITTHNVAGAEDLKTLERHFSHLFDRYLNEITIQDLEKWRTHKLATKAMLPNTINRTITPLRSLLSKAVEWNVIAENGLAGLKVLKYDDTRIRYLAEDERSQLFDTLACRENTLKAQRRNANTWRKERKYECYPEIMAHEFADHVLPMIILSLNTGIRKSELFRIKRQHINLAQNTVFIEKSKNYLARYVPLNKTARNMLVIWLAQTNRLQSPWLFPSPYDPNKAITCVYKAWVKVLRDSNIMNFRWHDMRHDFASNLVMKGVSLYAVQKLLGHKKIDQTMKYAHLAPDYIAESVGRLD